ncbi:MAG: hypothetical protein IPH08_07805 [Rhodocyclaceae bacterium]|jgi:uncharacterized membrane protein YebE (DUF533 family)|nr:hypothetical protein [Rhodocyclaceae bacterium]MBK6906983.1 hypothetical protein [Rhodocyclaceae bacterium]
MQAIHDQNLSSAEVVLLARAMLSVATIDGIHPSEAALIGQFYESSRSADMPPTASVLVKAEAQPFQPAEAAGCNAEFADTLVLMCLMTAHADGHFTVAERACVQAIATATGMATARFDALLADVRDQLVGALAHLPDSGSVANVLGELNAVS